MNEIIKTIGSKVLDVGVWKFYAVFAVFLLSFLINFFDKSGGYGEDLTIWASIIIMFICLIFIVIAHASQLIL